MLNRLHLFTSILLSLSLFSCSKDDIEDDTPPHEDKTSIPYETGESLYLDGIAQIDSGNTTDIAIDNVEFDGKNLSLLISYSGCENNPKYNIYWDGNNSSNMYHMVIVMDDLGDCATSFSDTVDITMNDINFEEKPVELAYATGKKTTIRLNPFSTGYENITTIRAGHLSKKCTDTCAFELLMNSSKYYYYSVQKDSDTTFSGDRTTLYTEWNSITSALDTNTFFALNNDLTTSDTVDTEWITVVTKSQSHRVEFDRNSNVSEISNLVETLREVKQSKVQH